MRLRKKDVRVELTPEDLTKLQLALSLLNDESQPNLNALSMALANLKFTNLNLKFFGYELARSLAAALPERERTAPRKVDLKSKASVQADLESRWAAHWCRELKIPIVFHRKVWELAYVLQAVYENGHLQAGKRGVGFGCGAEPLTSFFASRDITVTVTDLAADEAQSAGWAATNQHATSLANAYHAHLVDRERFDRLVDLQFVDMNAIPDTLADYDFCWSVCSLEHLGSIRQGLDFIENSLRVLKPGGLAVHTTEYNFDADGPTIDNWPTVLFQQKHFEEITTRLQAKGHYVAPLNFDIGRKPMDRFIDLPPWRHDLSGGMREWLGREVHLKVAIDGFPSTCFGMVIRKAG